MLKAQLTGYEGEEDEEHDCDMKKEIADAVNQAVEKEIAKRRDPIYRDDAPSKVKYIFEDHRHNPISSMQLVTLVIDIIKREIEYQKEIAKIEKVSKWAEQKVRAEHMHNAELAVGMRSNESNKPHSHSHGFKTPA